MVSVVGLFMVSVVAGNVFQWFPSLVVLWFSVVAGQRFFMVSVAGFSLDSAVAGRFTILERLEWFLVVVVFRTGFRRWFLWFPSWQENMFLFYGFRRWLFNGFRRGKERFFVCGFRRWFCYGFRLLQESGSLSNGNHKNKRNIRTFPWRIKYVYIYIYIYM